MKKYTTLLFDIDNTLLDFYAAESFAIRKLFEKYGLPNDDEAIKTYSGINKSFWELYEKGIMQKSEILVARFKKILEYFKEEKDAEQMNLDYFGMLSECYFLIDGATDILKYLKNKGYYIYAATNGLARTQLIRIEKSGIGVFLDGIFISETVGSQKPTREYFDYVIEHIPEKERDKILVIGDSMTSDIKGGRDSGLDTCWYDGYGEEKIYEPTYTVTDLKQLAGIL